MGLDVYLYARAEREASDAHNVAWETWYEQYKDAPDDDPEKVAARDAIPPYSGPSDVPSEKHPGHLFNRRYLRSSYNGSGYNRAVPDFLADPDRPSEYGSLNWIFAPVRVGEDDAELTEASIPALEQAKARAIEAAEALRKCDPLRVMDATAMFGAADHLWVDLPTDDQVLAWYREEKARNASATYQPDGWYSTAKGTVFGFDKGADVLALTLGKDILGRPCAMAVYRSTALDSYVESAEIAAEFCDEAIMLVRRDGSAFMSWSG